MTDPMLLAAVALVFLVGGLSKGVIGLGLPTITIGLLALVMPPAKAAAILLLPSLVTNLMQIADRRYLISNVQRLWPLLLGVMVGTLVGAGWLVSADRWLAGALLGLALIAYGLLGLSERRFSLARSREAVLGPLAGAATGLVTAATGVFVIPCVPYLQAIGLEKDELVQALGLAFLAATVALGANLWLSGALGGAIGPLSLLALVAALAGMGLGRWLRGRLSAATFRRVFFASLTGLGVYLVARAAF